MKGLEKLRQVFRPQSLRTRETIAIYRQAFMSEAGRVTMVWLLERCGLMKRIENEEQRMLHNWGIELLENMGVTQGFNYRTLVDAILKLGIPQEAVDEVKE